MSHRSIAALSLAAVLGAGLTLSGAPRAARAHGADSGGLQLPTEARTVTPDGGRAKEILARVEKDAAQALIAREPIAKSKRALQRADGAAASGDTEGARLLSRLALAHATSADATLRAVDAEKKANTAQTATAEVRDKLVRTKTLLAETQAQRGQIAAELAHAEEEAKANAARAQSKEDARVEKGDKAKPKGADKKGADKKGADRKGADKKGAKGDGAKKGAR